MHGQCSHKIILLFSPVLCQIMCFTCHICVMINPDGFCIAKHCQNLTVFCLFMEVLHSLHKQQKDWKSAISAFDFVINIVP